MATTRYTASKSLTKGGTSWVMSFRHPMHMDVRGNQGRKMRRGLGTGDEAQAQALVGEMNTLLGEPTWHSIAKRSEAERKFSPIVVRAFYDPIESDGSDSWCRRNDAMPLPGREDGYTRVMMVGTTGAGKTSLLRQLIGSHPERDRFPSTSASRTTISDIEVISFEGLPYRAVVTFFDESTIYTNVHECVANACAALWDDLPDERLAERLLTHRDLRFRLSYVIGSWRQSALMARDDEEGWSYEDEIANTDEVLESDTNDLPDVSECDAMHKVLAGFLGRVRQLAIAAKRQLDTELDIDLTDLTALTRVDKESTQDLFEDIVQSLPDFDELVNDIMDEIRARFKHIDTGNVTTTPSGWLQSWECEVTDRDTFIRSMRRFSSNYAPAFGTLLTPLVDGIRVQGSFAPTFYNRHPKVVLLDGEGLGHVSDAAAGLPSRIVRRFADVDVILLVDSAKAPMLEAPASVLRTIVASGYQRKCFIAFTHFDLLRGQANLPTLSAQRTHVLSSLDQKLVSLKDIVGQSAVRALERALDGRCFMLGFLDKPLTPKNRGPVTEIGKLIEACEQAICHENLPDVCPVYDTAGLVLAIQSAAADFHERWDVILGFKRTGNIRTAHWAEVKALNRRVVQRMNDGEYKYLKPVSDLVARLKESITKFLGNPTKWKPTVPSNKEVDRALERVQEEVSSRLQAFVEEKLLQIPRRDWVKAFEYRGRGSTFNRAKVIQTIYNVSAPIPGPALDPRSTAFLREVRKIVHDAIEVAGGELVSGIIA